MPEQLHRTLNTRVPFQLIVSSHINPSYGPMLDVAWRYDNIYPVDRLEEKTQMKMLPTLLEGSACLLSRITPLQSVLLSAAAYCQGTACVQEKGKKNCIIWGCNTIPARIRRFIPPENALLYSSNLATLIFPQRKHYDLHPTWPILPSCLDVFPVEGES